MGGVASALSFVGLSPRLEALAQGGQSGNNRTATDYDSLAKLGNNENPFGPSEVVMKAMNAAWKYSNRYGYPDGGITKAIADYHGVKEENILLGAGSGEILKVVDDSLLVDHKKIVGVDPTYESVYRYATTSKADAIKIPLLKDYRMDVPGIVRATKMNYRDVGFVYICNPNNPTGNILSKDEIRQIVETTPDDVPILIDEAYHHFVDDPSYATSIPYVTQGRPVIIARTFSKIAGLAGMRLGYAISTKELISRMRPFANSSINALVKHGGVAALQDVAYETKIRNMTIDLRKKVGAELNSMGYPVIPSQTNFFMVHVKRDVTPVIEEFRKKGVVVGRKFPPMVEHLRVSIGTEQEMSRFMVAFKEIFGAAKPSSGAGN